MSDGVYWVAKVRINTHNAKKNIFFLFVLLNESSMNAT